MLRVHCVKRHLLKGNFASYVITIQLSAVEEQPAGFHFLFNSSQVYYLSVIDLLDFRSLQPLPKWNDIVNKIRDLVAAFQKDTGVLCEYSYPLVIQIRDVLNICLLK